MTVGPKRRRGTGGDRTAGLGRSGTRATVSTRAARRWVDRPAVPTAAARGDALASALDRAGAQFLAALVAVRRSAAGVGFGPAAALALAVAVAAIPPGLRALVLAGPVVVATATALPFLAVRLTVGVLERRQP